MRAVDTSVRSGTPTAEAPETRVWLLGGFETTIAGSPIRMPDAAARLVAFIALHDGPLARPYVAGSLWPDTTEERAAANLRSVLWRLRRSAPSLVIADGAPPRLRRSVRVDLAEVRRILDLELDQEGEPRIAGLHAIVAMSELLPGWYDEWVVVEREHLRELRLRALQSMCERFTALGRFAPAVEAGSAAVRDEPLRESAHRALIRAHLSEGNVGEALRQFRRYERILDEELGLAPSVEMRGLVDLLTTI